MDSYQAMAQELLLTMERSTSHLHHLEVNASMRGEMAVMRLLDQADGALTAGDISRLLEMTTSRIAAVLGTLEKKGLIVRQADHADRRRVLVTLTESGTALCRMKRQCMLRRMTQLLAALGEEDAAHFVRLMKRAQALIPDICRENEQGGML